MITESELVNEQKKGKKKKKTQKESCTFVHIYVIQWGSQKSELKITRMRERSKKEQTKSHSIQNEVHFYIFHVKIGRKYERRLTVNEQNRTTHISRCFQ